MQQGRYDARADTHFEIQARSAAGWTVIGVDNVQADAEKKARAALGGKGVDAVRVIREREAQGGFHSKTVFEEEQSSGPKQPSTGNAMAPCRTPQDLEKWSTCHTANLVLRDTLDAWGMIGSELFFSVENYTKLATSGGVLQSALAAGVAHIVGEDDLNIQERARALYVTVKEAADRLKKAEQQNRIPQFQRDNVAALAATLDDSPDRLFRFSAAMARRFSELETIETKFLWLLKSLHTMPKPWAVELIDRWLAESLMHHRVREALLGWLPNRGTRCLILALLMDGQIPRSFIEGPTIPRSVAPRLDQFNSHMTSDRLPKVRQVLGELLVDALIGTDPLADGKLTGELTVLHEIYSHKDIDLNMRLRGKPLSFILERRAARMVNSENIGALTETSVDPLPGMRALLALEAVAIGDDVKKLLADYFYALTCTPKRVDALTRQDEKSTERLRELAQLQRGIIMSDFPDEQRDRLKVALDKHFMTILTQSGLLKKMQKSRGSGFQKAYHLAKMLADGQFTHGAADDLARRHVWQYLRSRDVILRLVRPRAKDTERKELESFYSTLERAGIEEPIAAPTVL